MVFINKMDREGKDPFDLLDEVESELGIRVRPLSWPINSGVGFKGVYNIHQESLNLYTPNKQVVTETVEIDLNSEELENYVGDTDAAKLRDDLELIEGVYSEFDVNEYLAGDLAPVFFGSALNTFGVKELLDCFVEIAPSPRPVDAIERTVDPYEKGFSGFIFKIHANMDPNHRSCIAFVKICSGKFERNVNYKHIRHGKMMKFSELYKNADKATKGKVAKIAGSQVAGYLYSGLVLGVGIAKLNIFITKKINERKKAKANMDEKIVNTPKVELPNTLQPTSLASNVFKDFN
jgi:peptide chain release factor 3